MAGEEHGSGSDAVPEGTFVVSSRRVDHRVVVELKGELDIDSSSQLAAELEEALDLPADRLEIDASDLTFVDSAGLYALLVASNQAETRGTTFQVTAVSPLVRRVIELGGLGAVLLPPPQEG